MNWFLAPGNLICTLLGMPEDGETRMIFRSLMNMFFYGIIIVIIAYFVGTSI
tara:strand:- start:5428 stop:5583 length:156 start_codon:yes stop_codon:yes gene_type:complete